MRRNFLLPFACLLVMAGLSGCINGGSSSYEIESDDDQLSGQTITAAADADSPYYKLFVLNQGKQGENGAWLDFLRYDGGKYVPDAFSRMNSDKALGDVANDIKLRYNAAWIALNGSGIVEVISAIDEKEIVAIPVPSPRQVTFYGDYAYVTSYAGPVSLDGEDRLGKVYKISLLTGEVVDDIEVGYQPEGIVSTAAGRLYVANSGGFHAGYDRTVSVIDVERFAVIKTIDVAANLQSLYYDYAGNAVWATSFGDYYSEHSGIYRIDLASDTVSDRSADLAAVRHLCAWYGTVPVGTGSSVENCLMVIGSDDEWNWDPSAERAYSLYRIRTGSGAVEKVPFSADMAARIATPYAVLVNPSTQDIYVGDAADYRSDGKVVCFDSGLKFKWEAAAGVDPCAFALYIPYL